MFIYQRRWKIHFPFFCTDVLILICSVLNHLQTVNPHSTSSLPAPTDYRIVKHSLTKHLQSSRKKINGSSILVSTMWNLQHQSLCHYQWHNESFRTVVGIFLVLKMVPENTCHCVQELHIQQDQLNKIHTNGHCFDLY